MRQLVPNIRVQPLDPQGQFVRDWYIPLARALSLQATISTSGFTAATLPVGVVGDRTFVTDAVGPTFLAPIVGGGGIVCPVFFNGVVWVAG